MKYIPCIILSLATIYMAINNMYGWGWMLAVSVITLGMADQQVKESISQNEEDEDDE